MKPSSLRAVAIFGCLALGALAGQTAAQNAPPQPDTAPAIQPAPGAAGAATPAAGRGGRGPAYPMTRSTDPVAVQRGRELFVNSLGCAYCHAADLRGADGGNKLLRSVAVMIDANGELIGRATRQTPGHKSRYTALTDAQFQDIAQYMKSIPNIGTGGVPIITPAVYRSGDPVAGQRYFIANCADCHAVTSGATSPAANLAGIGANIPAHGIEARALQQRWLNPPTSAKPTTAAVILADGQKFEGVATQIDEFRISLTLANGTTRTFERDGDNPKIEMTYPLAGHAALLRRITDKDIHDVTGYLVTLK